MSEPLTSASAALLLLITALLIAGEFRIGIGNPATSSVTVKVEASGDLPSANPAPTQPLFPGQPGT